MKPSRELMPTSNDSVDEKYILQECQKLLSQVEIKSAPVNLRVLASFVGVSSIQETDMPESGMLVPGRGGNLTILLRKADPAARKNFTCGHEIAHTFFPDYRAKPQKRVDSKVGEYDRNNRTEFLCDYGASQLLMPDFLFKPEFKKLGFNAGSLKKLSQEFDASLEATAMRMVSQKPKQYGVVVWENKIKPTEAILEVQDALPGFENTKPEKKLRVRFGYGLRTSGHIPKHKSLDEDGGIIQKSFADGQSYSGTEQIDFGNGFSETFKISTFPLPKQGRLISLLESV